MDDVIRRQSVLDAITASINQYGGRYTAEQLNMWGLFTQMVKEMPSAEEESFEWCTDCKEYDQEAHCCHRWSKMIRKTVEEIRGTTAIGEWVKVHGFVTPGGDPVWRCSNCGKGVHVYGIEHGTYGADIADNQWVACPNCGAIMIGERDG